MRLLRFASLGGLVVALACGEPVDPLSEAPVGPVHDEGEAPRGPRPVVVEPTLPLGPDEPTAPSEPTEPTEPAEPTEPTEPLLGPPYPIVLVHGFSGWSDAGPLEYFFDVLADLEEHGELEVFAPALPPYASSQQRAEVLGAFIDQVIRETRREKVHLIAHSQGGVDSRRVVSALGYASKVASLTTVASPHRGTPLADAALAAPDGILNAAGQMLAWFIGAVDSPPNEGAWDQGGVESGPWDPRMVEAVTLLSTEGMAAFNEAHPDPEGLPIFSVAAYSNLLPAPSLCGEGVWAKPSRVDAQDPLLVGSGMFLSGLDLLHPRANDGIVPTDSMPWGTFLGCVPADHLDQIGQIADLLPNLLSGFEHKAFFRKLVAHARSLEPTSP